IFPNPTSNTISWNTEDNYILSDIRGVQLVNGYGNALDLTDFASGLYLFKIGNEVVKVVRE
ncbi:MAG TPA: T9SS type A sorting domain-containing protein, partial [Saprospiraceae bacterium]|nr:T9SS type A sorting domain-containing protein [Saprospiraceae bacterium]